MCRIASAATRLDGTTHFIAIDLRMLASLAQCELHEFTREAKHLDADQRKAIRQQQSKPVLDALHQWIAL
jgi:hypothetical protein